MIINGIFMLYLQYFNQILTVVLEVLDDSDSSIRELALSLIIEMLKNQVCYLYKLAHNPCNARGHHSL